MQTSRSGARLTGRVCDVVVLDCGGGDVATEDGRHRLILHRKVVDGAILNEEVSI